MTDFQEEGENNTNLLALTPQDPMKLVSTIPCNAQWVDTHHCDECGCSP